MKKLFPIILIFAIAALATGCRTSKYGCPAVASHPNAKIIKA